MSPIHLTEEAWSGRPRSKYRAKGYRDGCGLWHASKHEGSHWQGLKLRLRAGEITELVHQPRYPLIVNGVKVATYVADARFKDAKTGRLHIVDAKSPATRTPLFRLKRNLFMALNPGLQIEEV